LRRLGAEWEDRDGGTEHAAQCLDSILMLRPRDEDALRALARVYRQSGRYPQLQNALSRHLEVTETPATRREIHAEMGRIYDTQLGETARAIESYLAVEQAGGEAAAELA